MSSKIQKESDGSYTLSINLKFEGSMLEIEEYIQERVNEIGLKATLAALAKFDTQGEALQIKGKSMSSKGAVKKSTKPLTDQGK
ncbi:MAG: hypothetical protein AAF927_02175 [Bacteroidota bacterium]